MKSIFKKIIVYVITLEAKLVLRKYKPKIVAVTGNIGKTSSKDVIFATLSNSFFVRKSEKSFNSDIGIPLTILGLPNAWGDFFLWFKNIVDGLKVVVLKNHYPNWLVLEIGADRPGDIEKVSEWIQPDVVVVTHLPDVPVHIEYFSSPEELVKEKSYLIQSIKQEGIFVVNGDDKKALALQKLVEDKKTISYGFSDDADVTASDYTVFYDGGIPKGISFNVNYKGSNILVTLSGVLGRQHIYPVLSAVAVGMTQDLNIISTGKVLQGYESAPGRMKLLDGVHNSVIIDDSYNASPMAMEEALKTLTSLKITGKKIAVLGDMMELGEYSYNAHTEIGKLAAQSVDILFTIGVRSKHIAQSAFKAKMKKKNIFECTTSEEVGEKLVTIIGEKDVVLVKGSQSIRTEKVIEKIMAHPERKSILLVRQEE